MPHATWIRGRRGAVAGASAALVCLGGALASCGSADGDGYVAVGSGAGSPRPTVGPTGDVAFVPLEGERPPADSGRPDSSGSPGSPGSREEKGTSGTANGPGAQPALPGTPDGSDSDSGSAAQGSGSGSGSGRTTTDGPPASTPPPASGPPAGGATATPSPTGPAGLSASEPGRKPTDKRWCEKVTVEFRNTGGATVRSGKVTLGTHVIDALGIDWATVESTRKLPAPIAVGSSREKTWTVCVEEWRVPLGMHIETQDVSVKWK
ncbi:hypothetical protein [Streptomyces sp. NPDC046862]|uniref:hypothetical protein n=1 Tax=Streptomyces sp. NPDC046862 TaxID=3154603 RepID=UPI003452783B